MGNPTTKRPTPAVLRRLRVSKDKLVRRARKVREASKRRLRQKAVRVALWSSLLLLVVSYLVNNMALFTGEQLDNFALVAYLRSLSNSNNLSASSSDEDEILYINVAYDKALTHYTYHNDRTGKDVVMGTVEITDREKLLRLLTLLSNTDYRYIIMDVRFERGYEALQQGLDTALFRQIQQMRDIVIATHPGVVPMTDMLDSVTAYNDYYSTITATNFVRYNYIHRGRPTMPLVAYEELTGNTITPHAAGLFYTSDAHLCHKSLFLGFDKAGTGRDSEQRLGHDILSVDNAQERLKKAAKDKIVVIGDFDNDLHDTYAGRHSGGKLLATALRALERHKHYVNWWLVLLLFGLYSTLTYSMYSDKRWFEYVPLLRDMHFPLAKFFLSFIGYSAVLLLCAFLLALLFDIYLTFFVPSLWLSVLSSYITYKRQ